MDAPKRFLFQLFFKWLKHNDLYIPYMYCMNHCAYPYEYGGPFTLKNYFSRADTVVIERNIHGMLRNALKCFIEHTPFNWEDGRTVLIKYGADKTCWDWESITKCWMNFVDAHYSEIEELYSRVVETNRLDIVRWKTIQF